MKGSVNVSLGYGQYTVGAALLAYGGADTENDSDPATDWVECQSNALANCQASTVLGGVAGGYGSWADNVLKGTTYDSYGSRASVFRAGWRAAVVISNTWKSNGQLFKMYLSGYHNKVSNTGAPLWTNYGEWDDFGRIYFKLSEDPALFTSGGDALNNFGAADFYVDFADLNNAQRAVNPNPWSTNLNRYIQVELPLAFIQGMTGNDLYIWAYTPYHQDAYWGHQNSNTVLAERIAGGGVSTYY